MPENRDFAYQYWFKNCATIPRDYLDEILDGQVRAQFAGVDAGVVFRDYVRRNLQSIPFVVPGLDVVMNGNIDRPISKWEEMFLPRKLRETLLEMPRVDDDGKIIPGTRLLGETTVLIDQNEDTAEVIPDFLVLTLVGLTPLGAAGLAGALKQRQKAYRALGIAGILWGALSGFVGLALVVNWLVSGHPDTWHNPNLLLFFPIDWLFVRIGFGLWRAGDRIKDRLIFLHSGRILAWAHVLGFAVLVMGAASGMIEQNIWRVVGWFGLPTILLSLAYAILAFGAPVVVPVVAAAARDRARKPQVARSR